MTDNPASQMFTALNQNVAAGFKKGNDAIKEGYDAVKDVPTNFKNQFSDAKSWVQQIGTITSTGSSLDTSILLNFPTMTLDGPSFSSPSASPPAFGPGQAGSYPGSNTAPYYSIYGTTGNASYSSQSGSGQASSYLSVNALPSLTLTKETLYAYANYSTGTPETGATVSVVGAYEKIMTNQDRDSWSVNLNFSGSKWSGSVSAASKHGPVSISGTATFSSGQLYSQNFSGSFTVENNVLTVNYSKMLQNGVYRTTQSASYRNTVFENITLMADYNFDSTIGTRTKAGAGYRYNDKAYIGAIFGSSSPLVGPATTAGTVFGSVPLTNNLWTLQTSITITNGNVTNDSVTMLTEQIASYTPLTFRTLFIDNYEHFKDDWFAGFQVIRRY